jgi:hypothetical protein
VKLMPGRGDTLAKVTREVIEKNLEEEAHFRVGGK